MALLIAYFERNSCLADKNEDGVPAWVQPYLRLKGITEAGPTGLEDQLSDDDLDELPPVEWHELLPHIGHEPEQTLDRGFIEEVRRNIRVLEDAYDNARKEFQAKGYQDNELYKKMESMELNLRGMYYALKAQGFPEPWSPIFKRVVEKYRAECIIKLRKIEDRFLDGDEDTKRLMAEDIVQLQKGYERWTPDYLVKRSELVQIIMEDHQADKIEEDFELEYQEYVDTFVEEHGQIENDEDNPKLFIDGIGALIERFLKRYIGFPQIRMQKIFTHVIVDKRTSKMPELLPENIHVAFVEARIKVNQELKERSHKIAMTKQSAKQKVFQEEAHIHKMEKLIPELPKSEKTNHDDFIDSDDLDEQHDLDEHGVKQLKFTPSEKEEIKRMKAQCAEEIEKGKKNIEENQKLYDALPFMAKSFSWKKNPSVDLDEDTKKQIDEVQSFIQDPKNDSSNTFVAHSYRMNLERIKKPCKYHKEIMEILPTEGFYDAYKLIGQYKRDNGEPEEIQLDIEGVLQSFNNLRPFLEQNPEIALKFCKAIKEILKENRKKIIETLQNEIKRMTEEYEKVQKESPEKVQEIADLQTEIIHYNNILKIWTHDNEPKNEQPETPENRDQQPENSENPEESVPAGIPAGMEISENHDPEPENSEDPGDFKFETYEEQAGEFMKGTYHDVEVYIRKSDGFVNATTLCDHFGKQFRDFIRTKAWTGLEQAFSEEYSTRGNSRGCEISQFIGPINAGISNKHKFLRGQYVHPRMVHFIMYWANPRYAITVGKIMDALNERQKLTGRTTQQLLAEIKAKNEEIRRLEKMYNEDMDAMEAQAEEIEAKIKEKEEEIKRLQKEGGDNQETILKLNYEIEELKRNLQPLLEGKGSFYLFIHKLPGDEYKISIDPQPGTHEKRFCKYLFINDHPNVSDKDCAKDMKNSFKNPLFFKHYKIIDPRKYSFSAEDLPLVEEHMVELGGVRQNN